MLSLRTNMHQYYMQADGIPQYIIMLEDAQKKAKRADMPIADVKLVMMASAAVLAAQHFPREVDDWEGLPAASRTWTAWKTAFRLAHLKRQRQILALGGGEPLGGAHGVTPAPFPPDLDRLKSALDNLALASTNDKTVLEQLTAANLALPGTIAMLTATNKKLADKARSGTAGTPRTPGTPGKVTRNPHRGNYCWTHGHRVSKEHMSATCFNKAAGHKDDATLSNTMGGSENDKGWGKPRT
jgi:hypothetical protein